MRNDLTSVIARSPDSDSDNDNIDKFIEKSIELFSDYKVYKRDPNGLFCFNGESDKPHPLLGNVIANRKRKSIEAKSMYEFEDRFGSMSKEESKTGMKNFDMNRITTHSKSGGRHA